MNEPTPVERAAEAAGGQSKLARIAGVSPAFVWQWGQGIRPVSPFRCPAIEAATGVRCEELRPDLTWLRDASGKVTGHHVSVTEGCRNGA